MDFRTTGEAIGRRAAACALALALCACVDKSDLPRPVVQADAAAGLAVIKEVGCAACHRIPDVAWPEGRSGSNLAGFGARPLIAGRLPNQPDVLIRWLIDAPSMDPGTAMPPMPLTQDQARDVAAYLYTLDED
ncbi:c-type cytochrome [Brevundimonas vesicularis]|uniref:C-type cytochrome n=1 Tax=Brevundimonas vesicularis TaxID=41276 RepID=A0ABU4KKR8_BREVE|nr:c-type cytochrome [Brevundimonas vesicularis]MDX2333595.1 c-type cytochrome [Brevundimonas vesicularis]